MERRRGIYQDALAVIERSYTKPLEVDLIAREVATSRRQLQRVFEEIGGRSIRTAIAEVRMRRAVDLLEERPEMAIRHIGAAVGYHQPAQFAKAFRRLNGKSPREARRALLDAA